jgi:hypothetical protein
MSGVSGNYKGIVAMFRHFYRSRTGSYGLASSALASVYDKPQVKEEISKANKRV